MSLSQFSSPYEKPPLSFKGDREVVLKTTDGCGEAYDIIINRGNSANGFPATIGYLSSYPCCFVPLDTVPDTIKDVAYSNVFAQYQFNGSALRYFAVITSGEIYLYSSYPINYMEPHISLVNSIVTPVGYVESLLYDPTQLLIVNQPPDSTNFTYTFYHLPDLSISGQVGLAIYPEKIIQQNFSYLICGDSLGVHKLFKVSPTTFQITQSFILPPEAMKVKAILYDNGTYDYLLAAPGDTEVNLIKVNESNSAVTAIHLCNDAGIFSSNSYYQDEFLFQPLVDSAISTLGKQLIEVNAFQGIISDTININQRVIAIQSGYYLGFGGIYNYITATNKGLSHDWVYLTSNGGYSFDSLQAGANPTWFVGDVRCYSNVPEIERNLDIKVFPNPATDNVQIFVSGLAENKTYNFTISDIYGKLLWQRDLLTKENYTVPMQQFPSGVLIMRVDAGSKSVTEKILKL